MDNISDMRISCRINCFDVPVYQEEDLLYFWLTESTFGNY